MFCSDFFCKFKRFLTRNRSVFIRNTLILNILTISDMGINSAFYKTMTNGLHFMKKNKK